MNIDYEYYEQDKEISKRVIIDLIESMSMEVVYYIEMGNYERAEELRSEMEALISDLQN